MREVCARFEPKEPGDRYKVSGFCKWCGHAPVPSQLDRIEGMLKRLIVGGVDWAKDSAEGGETAINEIPRAYFQKEGKQ